MKFRTEFKPRKSELTLNPHLPLVTLGSCFADEISSRMRDCLWKAGNPAGVLFNPLSIAKALELLLFTDNADEAFSKTLFETSGIYHSWMFDSSGSAKSGPEATDIFKNRKRELESMIDKGRTLCVTFGTSYCYFLSEYPDFVVANCHKQPTEMFIRRRIGIGEITEIWSSLITKLQIKYPGLQIIFTVSPVRHIRDGLHENELSKATLLLAIDKICSTAGSCHYFPSYEIVNDDLRDYRFYAADLVHPSDMAVEYIWEIFKETYLDAKGLEFIKEGSSIVRRANHRPILASEKQTEEFRRKTARLYSDFQLRHPDCLKLM